MILEVGFDSVRTMRAAGGRNTHDNLPSAGDVEGQNIAARIARRTLGSAIGIGVMPAREGVSFGFVTTTGWSEQQRSFWAAYHDLFL